MNETAILRRCRRAPENGCGRGKTETAVLLRSLQRAARFDVHRLIAVGGERSQDIGGVRGVARLDGHIELGALGRHVKEQAAVIDFENIGAEFAEPGCDNPEHAGPVRNGEAERDDASSRARVRAP